MSKNWLLDEKVTILSFQRIWSSYRSVFYCQPMWRRKVGRYFKVSLTRGKNPCDSSVDVLFCCSVSKSCPTICNPWTAACQVPLPSTLSQSLLKFMSTESVMLSNHLILCYPPSSCAFNLSRHQDLFRWVDSSHQVAEVLEPQLQHQSFQWMFRVDFL